MRCALLAARANHDEQFQAQIALRIDADAIKWFRAQGSGGQTRMNAVLKPYRQAIGPQNG